VGLEMRRRWDTLRDSLVCPICGPLNGLPEEDWRVEFPNGPPSHPNCRCSTSLTMDDEATIRAEAIASQTAREKLLREKVAGEGPIPMLAVNYLDAPAAIMERNGYSAPTDEQKAVFQEHIDAMPAEIKKLWRGGDVMLAVSQDAYEARRVGNWIILPKGFAGTYTELSQHEFKHRIIGQSHITDKLGGLSSEIPFYNHAKTALSVQSQKNEEIVMNLDFFDADRDAWVSRLMADAQYMPLEGMQTMTRAQAEQKVDALTRFFKWLGEW